MIDTPPIFTPSGRANPYHIEGPALISVSGGRTSGFMLRQILDAHGGRRVIYLAANHSRVWKLRAAGWPMGWIMSPDGVRHPKRGEQLMPHAIVNGPSLGDTK